MVEEIGNYGKAREVPKTPLSQSGDSVNHPDHYKSGGIEVIDLMKAKMSPQEFLGYLRGNIIKYVLRAPFKGKPVEDMRKARWYIDKWVEVSNETV